MHANPDNDFIYDFNHDQFYIDYRHVYSPGCHSVPKHRHNITEVTLCESGSTNMIIGNNLYHGEGHYLCYVPAHCVHETISNCSHNYQRYFISLDPRYLNDSRLILPQMPFILQLEDGLFEVLTDIAALLYKYYGTDGYDTSLKRPPTLVKHANPTRLAHLLGLFLDELKPTISEHIHEITIGNNSAKSRLISSVCHYINEHCSEKLTLDTIAAEHSISRTKLTSDFRELMNMSVGDYITTVRLSRSIPLLDGNLSISEVALACGFSSSSYFINCFRKHNGVTPLRFINQDDDNHNIGVTI